MEHAWSNSKLLFWEFNIQLQREPNPFNPEGGSNQLVRNVCVNYINIQCQQSKYYNLKALVTLGQLLRVFIPS